MITLVATLVVKPEAVEIIKEECKKMVYSLKITKGGMKIIFILAGD